MTFSTTSFADIALLEGRWTAGAVFRLNGNAKTNVHIEFDGGWSLQLVEGKSFAIIRGCDLTGFEPVTASAAAAASRGLDLLCAYDQPAYAFSRAADEFIVFWPERDRLQICWFSTHRFGFSMRGNLHAGVQDETEEVRSKREWRHHPSFSHFRRSQLETDLSDSYRHAYLALESILDSIHPQSHGQPEGDWLQKSLAAASRLSEATLSDSERAAKVADRFSNWYERERNRLFHAKESRAAIHQLSRTEFDSLIRKKRALLTFYISLCRVHLGVRNGAGGGITHPGFEGILQRYDEIGLSVCTMSDSEPRERSADASMIREPHSATPSGDGYFTCRNAKLPESRRVDRWEVASPEGLIFWEEWSDGGLALGALDRLSLRLRLVGGSGDFAQRFLT